MKALTIDLSYMRAAINEVPALYDFKVANAIELEIYQEDLWIYKYIAKTAVFAIRVKQWRQRKWI